MRKYGWVPPKEAVEVEIPKFDRRTFKSSKILESHIIHNTISIYDQGTLGSCTANAICAVLKHKKIGNMEPSRLFLYYNARENKDRDEGSSIDHALSTLGLHGICRENLHRYKKGLKKPSEKSYTNALKHLVERCIPVNVSKESFKIIISSNHMIVFGFLVNKDFEDIQPGQILNYNKDLEVLGGHAVVCIGYNLNGLLVRNSYGPKWGDQGNFCMSWEYLESGACSDAWIIL
jgi:C1A family cysteine protease